MSESVDLARRIVEKHVPNGPSSWASCVECRQHHRGASEAQPMWPCDARRLADVVLSDTPTAEERAMLITGLGWGVSEGGLDAEEVLDLVVKLGHSREDWVEIYGPFEAEHA